MIGLEIGGFSDRAIRILCVGAHSDDIEIGAGGTILELAQQYPAAHVSWHVLSAEGQRADEARDSAAYFTSGFAKAEIHIHEFPDGTFPAQLGAIKRTLEAARASFPAHIVFTHYRGDLHQDHRTVAEVTWQTFRDHLILEYEILKFDGDLGVPNAYVPVSDEVRGIKLEGLRRFFETQRDKDWFTDDALSALLRIRGVECRSRSGYAEAFYCRKAVIFR
ncbi:PIG-L deacetylase family protein [Lentisalinibacter salinarum]|uniref:PIG-L deacetylase family protein n=1 Tax=Lentisalinibacter salinarum TaxID=2992239 RepID=UPI00386C3C7D